MSTTDVSVSRNRATSGRDAGSAGHSKAGAAGLAVSYLSENIDKLGDSPAAKKLKELQNHADNSEQECSQLERQMIDRLTRSVMTGGNADVSLAAELIDIVSGLTKNGGLRENHKGTVFMLLDAIGSGKYDQKELKKVLEEFRKLSSDADGFTEKDAQQIRTMLKGLPSQAAGPAKNGAGAGAASNGKDGADDPALPPGAASAAAIGTAKALTGGAGAGAGADGPPNKDLPAAIGAGAAVDAIAGSAAPDADKTGPADTAAEDKAGAKGVAALSAADHAQGNRLTVPAEEEIGRTLTLEEANDPVFMSAFAARLNAHENLALNTENPNPAVVAEKQEILKQARSYATQCSALGMSEEDAVAFAGRLTKEEIADPEFMAALAARLKHSSGSDDSAYQFAAAMKNHGIGLEYIDHYAANLKPEEAADEAFMAMLANNSIPLAGQPADPQGALARTRRDFELSQARSAA